MNTDKKVALVLSGGGAKGAYHLGVLQAMGELGMDIGAVAGTSIGALNGAILASAGDFDTGLQRMCQVWDRLATQNPIVFSPNASLNLQTPKTKNMLGYLTFLLSSGLKLSNPIGITKGLTSFINLNVQNLLKDDVLHELMQAYLDINQLQNGLPFYVAVYPQNADNDGFKDFLGVLKDGFLTQVLGKQNRLAQFFHIQSLAIDEQKQMILASASLPLLFKAHQTQNARYTDGGQGGVLNDQGNTPITPLLQAGYKKFVVVHLDGGSLWHKHDFDAFGDIQVIEVRPSGNLGGFEKMLDFSSTHLDTLKQMGYTDARHILGELQRSFGVLNTLRQSTQKLAGVYDNRAETGLDKIMKNFSGGELL